MAVPTNTYQTYQAVGIREDLSDILADISPTERPLYSNIAHTTARQVLTEWQTDSLAAAVATNAAVEGDDATANTAVATLRFNNYCQIATKTAITSGTMRASDTAGREDEHDYQIAKRMRELGRDIEMTLAGTQLATAGAAASARVAAGLAGYIYTNLVRMGVSATTPPLSSGGHPSAAQVAGSATAITEALFKSGIALAWAAGGEPTLFLMDAANKQTCSTFTGVATQYRDNQQVGPGTIIGAMDFYVSDFGSHALVASRFMPSDLIYGVDTEYVDCAFLRPIQENPLAKTGDSDKTQILAEFTLRVTEPDAHVKYGATN